ncbi:MAG: Lrp/AsnC family transcriptional regulator [Candidatus Bathyarchaeota archaeon]|jgi:DNA-binding Lrp family transcriptional regulator
MHNPSKSLDRVDRGILRILQEDCRTPLEEIAKKLGISKSTAHYRVKRLESEGIIEGYYAKVNAAKLGKDFITITFVRAKYGLGYHEKVGRLLADIPGVWGVYFVLGEMDFVVLARASNREKFMEKLDRIISLGEVERTNTQVIAKILKEDPRIEL